MHDVLKPPAAMTSKLEGELLEISMGPQHPSTHGVFRMNVALDGETVVKLKPVFGYLHRNHEKIGENTSYLGSMPYTDRLDYFCSMTNNWAYALSVEKLAGIEVPERAEYLRVILAELTRLQNHASLLGFMLSDMGAWGTPLMYAFREREKILDLFESLSGARMMCDFMRFGGCRRDTPPGWMERAKKVVEAFPAFLDEFEALIDQQGTARERRWVAWAMFPNRETVSEPASCFAQGRAPSAPEWRGRWVAAMGLLTVSIPTRGLKARQAASRAPVPHWRASWRLRRRGRSWGRTPYFCCEIPRKFCLPAATRPV